MTSQGESQEMNTPHIDDDRSPLERFLSGGAIDPEDLGEPPLADSKDSLLDRERIHVETDEE